MDDAHAGIAATPAGSGDSEGAELVAAFEGIRPRGTDLQALLGNADDTARRYLDGVIADAVPVDRLRADLPPDVPAMRRGAGTSRPKTHGRWVGPSGRSEVIVSGKDELYDQAVEVFRGMKSRHILQRVSDVEMKLAAHMRKNGIRSATVVINNQPCGGPMGCDELVPVVLPPGYRLVVHGTNGFFRVYEGGGKSSWVP
ncbi:DddA-like double-stranded DNA deaminase toxin [Umezawaea tangerina]|uniref:DddA-like double-stranded DNA deaminase toxin n=1 Tax=Umezawaea tangerina TaxID=84725 RepID=UPI000A6DEC25|nr:DddA-like double-stranded DNA deaminase toxin [Umezawaea tangerina]